MIFMFQNSRMNVRIITRSWVAVAMLAIWLILH